MKNKNNVIKWMKNVEESFIIDENYTLHNLFHLEKPSKGKKIGVKKKI